VDDDKWADNVYLPDRYCTRLLRCESLSHVAAVAVHALVHAIYSNERPELPSSLPASLLVSTPDAFVGRYPLHWAALLGACRRLDRVLMFSLWW
jgi:hypothetical protein